MHCPICKEARAKRFWSPKQWTQCHWLSADAVGCKRCRLESSCGVLLSPSLVALYVEPLATGLMGLIFSVGILEEDAFDQFVEDWLALPASTRKQMSYNGACKVSYAWEPVHYSDAENKQFFDPGNAIYTWTIALLFPNSYGNLKQFLNNGSMGDILETLLAMRDANKRKLWFSIESAAKMLYGISLLLNVHDLCSVEKAVLLHARR